MSDDEEPRLTARQRKEVEFFDKLLDKLDQMTDEQKHQTFVRAGIVNQEGELTKPYGGEAEPED